MEYEVEAGQPSILNMEKTPPITAAVRLQLFKAIKEFSIRWISTFAAGASIAVLYGHWLWAIQSNCPGNFQRGGALVVGLSIVAIAWLQYRMRATDTVFFWGGSDTKRSTAPWYREPFVIAPSLAIIGTVVWGYGDILASNVVIGGCAR